METSCYAAHILAPVLRGALVFFAVIGAAWLAHGAALWVSGLSSPRSE